MAGVLAGQPLDTVRIRQQQPARSSGKVLSAAGVYRATVAREGARSLFRGMAYPLATACLQNAVVFHAFGVASRRLGVAGEGAAGVFWAGCFSGAVQTLVVAPVDLLKIRLQLQTALPGAAAYVGPLRLLRGILAREGLPGLYRGALVTAARDVPSHGVYFAAYDLCRQVLSSPGSGGGGGAAVLWASGGVAGALSWLSIYPLDVVKSRVQGVSHRCKGFVDCAVRSYQGEGPGVFIRGLGTTLARAFLVNGAIFSVYEAVHSRLGA